MDNHRGLHRRRSIRLPFYDYSQGGAYFLTLCTWERRLLFASIRGDAVELNGFGRIVQEEWLRSADIRRELALDAYIVMPNHVHGILVLSPEECSVGRLPRRLGSGEGPGRRSLASFVGGLKSATTKRINEMRGTPRAPVWQRNYYERVIRNERELQRAREYILDNPRKWGEDPNHPARSRPPRRSVGVTGR